MELEIKHVVPYLPYELKAEMLDYKKDYVGKKIDTILGIHQWDKSGKLWSLFTEGGSKPSLDSIKPILRHLSDFQEEQIEEIKSIFDKNWCRAYDDFFDALFQHDWDMHSIILMCPYEILQWFFKNHYDVFGLIEKGLAIDINTLNLNK
jgi:hypothetical protein